MANQLRAVDYLRVSTEEQRKGYGIKYTGRRTAAFIQRKGWGHVRTFSDEGHSGSLDHTQRPDLKRLMAMARETPRPFDVVVVNEERAIGRRDRAFWPWVWHLEDLGVFVAIVRGDYDNTTESGRSRMRKEADRAEDERILIRDRTQGGIQEKAEAGLHPGGRPRCGYRVEDKGVLGVSHIVLDDSETGEHAALRRAWDLKVREGKNTRQARIALNSEGLHSRSGPWTDDNLRLRLWDATKEPVVIFRDPRRAKLDREGNPLFGQSVKLVLPEMFNAKEREQLAAAMRRDSRPQRHGESIFTLTRRIASPCGRHYTGLGRGDKGDRVYRCAGRTPRREGEKACACANLPADAMEAAVWEPLRNLLSDADRLQRMSEDWSARDQTERADPEGRIADLASQIAEQESALALTTRTAAKEAARRGLGEAEADELIDRMVLPIQRELDDLTGLHREAMAWKERLAQSRRQTEELRSLADAAGRIRAFGPEKQMKILEALKIKVVLVKEPESRKARACPLGLYFQDRTVPVLDDDAWLLVEPIFSAARQRSRGGVGDRLLLEALLHKARTGCPWAAIPARYGPGNSVQTAYLRWTKNGVWEAVTDALKGVPGDPAPEVLPPLHITGTAVVNHLLTEMGNEVMMHAGEPYGSEQFGCVRLDFITPMAA